jgi:hypothetical protein
LEIPLNPDWGFPLSALLNLRMRDLIYPDSKNGSFKTEPYLKCHIWNIFKGGEVLIPTPNLSAAGGRATYYPMRFAITNISTEKKINVFMPTELGFAVSSVRTNHQFACKSSFVPTLG